MTDREKWIEEFVRHFQHLTEAPEHLCQLAAMVAYEDDHADCSAKEAAVTEAEYWSEEGG